jgi:hypothetical protein
MSEDRVGRLQTSAYTKPDLERKRNLCHLEFTSLDF